MEIRDSFINGSGQRIEKHYQEGDPLVGLDDKILHSVHALCFYQGKMVVIYSEKKKTWSVPGGGIDPGETYEQAVVREVREESNMKVLHQELIGFQDLYEPTRVIRQTRSFCIVEPYGDFVHDPDDGEVTEIKIIDPTDYKQYFDWGKVGEHVVQEAMRRLGGVPNKVTL